MSELRAEHEARYPGLPSRWLAYCYAVGREPRSGAAGAPPGEPSTGEWFAAHIARVKAELGFVYRGDMSDAKHQAVTEKLWQYAVEERDA